MLLKSGDDWASKTNSFDLNVRKLELFLLLLLFALPYMLHHLGWLEAVTGG